MNVTSVDFAPRNTRSSPDPSGFTTADARELWRTGFAPGVQELGLTIEECSVTGARLRLPYSPRLARFGDTGCGQALMACADSAMAFAIMSAFGGFKNITTVTQSITFMRTIARSDVLIDARIQKLGKSLAFAEVSFTAAGEDAVAARATSTWMLLP